MGYGILVLLGCLVVYVLAYLVINGKVGSTYDVAKETVRKVAKDKFSSSMDPRRLYIIFFDQTYRTLDSNIHSSGTIQRSGIEKEILCFMLFLFTHFPPDSWKNPHLTRGRFWQFCKTDHAKIYTVVSDLYPEREAYYLSALNGDTVPAFYTRFSSRLKSPATDPLCRVVSAFFDYIYDPKAFFGDTIVYDHTYVLRVSRTSIREFLEMEE